MIHVTTKYIMNRRLINLTIVLLSVAFPAFAKRPIEKAFKGIEMYSWKDDNGKWRFRIMNGTNRQKTEEWIKMSAQDTVFMNDLQSSFIKLAKGQEVYWFHKGIEGFMYPPESYMYQIEAIAKKFDIKISRGKK